jgi:6-phosphogluconolactonase (cycloisomerase 2 family)
VANAAPAFRPSRQYNSRGLHAIAVAVAPSGNFIYVSNWGAHDISAYRIERSWGAISPVAGTPFASGRWPHSLAIAPSKEFLYSANGDSNDVSAFSINEATGALEQVVGSPYRAGNHPEFVIISPSGEFAYVCNGFAGTISGYRIDAASGGLRELAGSPFASGEKPLALAIEPSGRFAYVANRRSDIWAYRIDGGMLEPIPGSPYPAGKGPTAITIHPSGEFVYFANLKSDDIGAYRIDRRSGALTPLPNTCAHWPSKSAGVLPSLSLPTCPAMNRNSDAFTRAMFEYAAIGLPRLSGLSIWILGMAGSGAVGAGDCAGRVSRGRNPPAA